MSAIQSACRAAVEGFADTAPNVKREVYADSVAVLLSFVLAFIILAFVGKLLWNNVVVDLFSFAKPARSFWQIIGLMIFVSLIRP
jgi:ABC-type uncharacterized transport system fused permease/ATPase subunit